MNAERQFLQLLGFALSQQPQFLSEIYQIDWQSVLSLARKHALVGVLFSCFTALPEPLAPDRLTRMTWGGLVAQIRQRNTQANRAVNQTIRLFTDAGYTGILLKGQGLSDYYPDPSLRTSGDIDYWVFNPDEPLNLSFVRQLKNFAKQNNPNDLQLSYHHCNFGHIDGVEVELHWRPSWFFCPWYNHRFQQLCCSSKYSYTDDFYPSDHFNEVFLLAHMYRHFLYEGVELKQLVDYYYFRILSSVRSAEEIAQVQHHIQSLGMTRFAEAITYILHTYLALPEDKLVCNPNAKEGENLLAEMLKAKASEKASITDKRSLTKAIFIARIRRICRNIELFRFAPAEILFKPFWSLWQRCWVLFCSI